MEVIQNYVSRDPCSFSELEVRSKLPPESHTGPWLVFFHDHQQGKKKKRRQIFFSISEDSFYVRSIDDMKKHDCWPTVQGWVFMKKPKSRKCFLLNPASSLEKTKLQPLEWSLGRNNCKCVLSATPDDPNFMVLIADFNDNYMYFCWPRDSTGKQYWKRHKCTQPAFQDVMGLNGTFYAIISSRFAIIGFLPDVSFMFLERLRFDRIVGFNYYSSLCSSRIMLESCGDIFLVRCFMDEPKSFGSKVTHVEVEKREATIPTWNEVDNIGGRVFFFDVDHRFAASWSTTELGVKGNCIYITTKGHDKHMYVFDMEEGTVCVRLPCPSLMWENCSQPFWMMLPA